MSMDNSSTINEQLISQAIDNVMKAPKSRRVSRLYWTIINNSILKSITEYGVYVELKDDDAIAHHGSRRKLVMKRYPNDVKNMAQALKVLRKHLPYKTAKMLVASKDNMRLDTLYHAINDFKFRCNSDFYTLFNLERQEKAA